MRRLNLNASMANKSTEVFLISTDSNEYQSIKTISSSLKEQMQDQVMTKVRNIENLNWAWQFRANEAEDW